jgi:NADPH:quinone reductase-like Zn-dependent oxidoreductase
VTSPNSGKRRYEIRINGHLDDRWTTWFDGMTVTRNDDGTTTFDGVIADQAALHGVLQRMRDAALPLVSVSPLVADGSSPIPTHMKAAVYHRFGGPEVVSIQDAARPEPAADEILIRVHATTVSAADHRARSRDVPAGLLIPSSLVLGIFRPKRPVLGMDAAGVVVRVGDRVERFAVGDEVVAMLGSRFGAHAEYAILKPTDAVAAKPAMSFEDAASLVFGGITARAYLSQVAIGEGTTVLVNGASGAVGSAVVQLGKIGGARVTGVSSAANHALVTSLGADRTIDYSTHDFAAEGACYDVIVDCVGNAPVPRVLDSLTPGGAVLLVAGDLRSIISAKGQARRHGITVITAPGAYRSEDLEYVVGLAERGAFRPTIDRRYPFEQIRAAHRFVDSGRKRGSVVVTIP